MTGRIKLNGLRREIQGVEFLNACDYFLTLAEVGVFDDLGADTD
jgi:hypothetical protein